MKLKPGGFTLVEVLIAIAIFGLFIVPLTQTQMLAGQSVMRMKERREALAIATDQLDQVQHDQSIGNTTSVVSGYQVVVTSGRLTGVGLPLTRIQVSVGYQGRTLATLSSYRM